MIDSVFRTGKNYYPQVFLGECKYVAKEKKSLNILLKDIEISSDESDKEDSDEEDSDEENSNKESYIEELIKNLLREQFILKNINSIMFKAQLIS